MLLHHEVAEIQRLPGKQAAELIDAKRAASEEAQRLAGWAAATTPRSVRLRFHPARPAPRTVAPRVEEISALVVFSRGVRRCRRSMRCGGRGAVHR